MAKFKQEVLDQINADSVLLGLVADALGIKPISLPKTLERNGAGLNQYSIVTLVASHLGKDPEELLEEDSEDTDQKEVSKERQS